MDTFRLPSGKPVPPLGQGTWNMGERRDRYDDELATLRLGIDLGLTLIDTAELYGSGKSEQLVSAAITSRRADIYLVSKVLPQNASRKGTLEACERSLKHLRTDYLDLYLLHWRGRVPLAETLEALVALQRAGKIRHYGVSNFDVNDMEEAAALPGGATVASNQILYNLARRGAEWDLLPWCAKRGIPIMAYSPLGSSGELKHTVLENAALAAVAARHDATPARTALAWLLAKPGVVTIPKASTPAHVRDNAAALQVRLTAADLADLDAAFPPPRRRAPLDVI